MVWLKAVGGECGMIESIEHTTLKCAGGKLKELVRKSTLVRETRVERESLIKSTIQYKEHSDFSLIEGCF